MNIDFTIFIPKNSIRCPKHKINEKVKNGKIKGLQRHGAKNCNYNFYGYLKSEAKGNRGKDKH